MTYGVKLPDGRIIGFDEAVSPEQAQQIVRRDFPEAFEKKTGIGAEFKEGLASLIGGTRTALTAPFDSKEAAKRGLLEEQARGAEFESGVSLDKLKQAYQDYGFLGGAGELTRQIPQAVSGMAPQIAASIGSAATGARIGSVAGLPGIVGGALGGFGASFLPIAGQNITRQAQVQEAAGQEIDPSLTKAYGAAAPAAALEVGSLGFTLGKRLLGTVFGQTEKEIAEGLAKNAVKYEADLVKAAQAKLLPTVAGGAARGLVEIPTEVAQQVLERAQAGLDLFSPDAISEYGSAAYQAGLVGPTVGGIASPINRAQARSQLEGLRGEQRAAKQREIRAEEEAYKASPEYIEELTTRQAEIQEELGVLKNILKTKPTDVEDRDARSELKTRKRDLDMEMGNIVSSLREVQPQATTLPLTSQQLVDRERNRLDEMAMLKQLKATDSRSADEYANYISAQDTYQAMQDKEAQRLLTREEKARQKEAKDIIDAYKKSVKGIEKTADAVTDEFGNIIPGLTKSGALAGRELTPDQRTKVAAYDAAVKELNDTVAAAGKISRQNLYDKTYVSDETQIDAIKQLQQNVQDRYQDIKDFAGERDIPQSNEVLDNLVAKLTEPPKEIPTELSPQQKEAEAKRVAELQRYKKAFYDAAAEYERLVQEAETKAETPRVKGERGTELYADAEKGRSLEVLTKGKEVQDALDAQNKAKGALIEFLNQPLGEAVTPLESADVLQDVALLDLTDTVDSMRKGEFFGGPNDKMATGSLATKAKKARNELNRLIQIVVNRINARRQANGLNKLSEKSTKEIEDVLLNLFGSKIERATGKLARVLKASEGFEGNTAMRQALEAAGFKFGEGRPTGEGEVKTGFSREEFKDVKDFVNDIEKQYSTKEREFGKLTRETTSDLFTKGRMQDTGKARKTEGTATDIEQTARLLDKVLDADLTAEQRTVFERAERMLGESRRTKDVEAPTASGVMKFMPGLVDSVEAQGNRVLKGLEPDLKELKEAIKRVDEAFATPVQEGVRGSEEGFKKVPATQLDMFPGETATIRANRQNFLKLMDIKKRTGSASVNAARKWLNGFKTTPPYIETARNFFKVIVDLQNEVSKLTRERDQLDPKKVSDYIGKIKNYDAKIAAVQAKIPQAEKDFDYHNNRSQSYVVSQFAKLFNNQPITNLLKEATALDAEGAKWISKSKNQGPDVVEEYRSWANQSFDLAETYRKEAYDIYADAEKDIFKKIEKIDKPDVMLEQFEAFKKRVDKDVKDTLAKQKAKAKELNLPEYPERIRLLRLQNKMLDKAIKSTKERIAEGQAEASRQTGLNLPGIKSEIPVQLKGEAALPHRYNAVENKFNFARQYYKEMLKRRSVTMNKAQTKAYQEASAKYKESRTKLNQAFKENNVDTRIGTIMNNMIEMDAGTPEYRKLENNIIGIEEQLQQKVLGFRASAEKRPSGYKATTIKEIKGKEAPEVVEKDAEINRVLSRDEKPTPAEEFVGRISEAELADFRKAENDAFEKAKKRLYGLSLQGEDKRVASEKERTALADEIKRLEKSIKATDIVLSARRVGMIVGQAQEEIGVKRYKPTETEKKMVREGKFEKAGIVPEYYSTVARSYRAREATAESALERKTPEYARSLIKRIVVLDERIANLPAKPAIETVEQEKTRVKEENRLTDEVAFLRKEFAAAMARTKAETLATAFQQVMDINFRYMEGKSGGIDLAVADSFINKMLKKHGFNPTRRAITAAIGAFTLPIKIPKLADVNADFKQMIVRNALSGLALNVKDDTSFENAFVEKHGGYFPDAMGDIRYKANQVTDSVLSLVDNTYNAIAKKDTFEKGVDKAVVFQEAFDDKIYESLRKLYTPFANDKNKFPGKESFRETVEHMLDVDRGQIGNPWQDAHSALYVNDPVEYAAMVTEAYTSALQTAKIDPQKAVEQIETAKAKTVTLASGVKFIYASDISQAPDALINAAIATNKDLFKVRGAVLPDGTVVVIGAAHTDINDLQETIAHELIGHYAVDTVLGESGMKALVKKVFAGGDEGVYKLATELGVYGDVTEAFLAAKNSNMPKEQMQMLITREMVAHVAERPIPSRASQAVKDFIKMVVNAVRSFFKANDFDKLSGATTQDIYNLIREATKQYDSGKLGAYRTPDGSVAFFAPSSYSGAVDQNSIDTINKLYAKNKTVKDKFLANFTGLAGTTQFLDRLAPAETIIKKAETAGLIDATSALETTFYLRQTDQRLNLTSQAATSGVPELVKNAAGEMEVLGKKDGANLIKVGTILERAKALGNAQAINDMFGAYLLHIRAKRVGIRTLSADLAVTKKELEDIDANIEAAGVMPIFKEAAEVYAQYNKDLINFAVQTGALSKEVGARLTKYNDYVPYYRIREGIAELVIAGETPINIGRLTDQPYLNELVGGKEMIMNFEQSAFQNTGVIVDLALRNLATSKLAQQLEKIKVAVRVNPKAKGTDIIRAKVNGVEAAWKLDTKGTPFEGIPADLLIKGLDGIKTQIPAAIKLLGLPSRWLRNMITRDPAYSARQIIKDSTAMWLYSGADAKPIGAATLELGKMWAGRSDGEMELQRSGLLGGQLFTGMPEDMSKVMLQITSGKTGWQSLLAKLDRLAIQGDAATRVSMYNAYIKQGLSPMRAKLATLEALNVNKRGLSPTVYMLSTLIPFMSTQVQGLNVFAKAMTGRLDLAGQKDLKAKLVTRGLTMAVFTMIYAAAMEDDEAYKNADPFVKYNSWFVRVPWLDVPIKVPTPFEFGYVFKGLPEALYNLMFTDEKAKNVLKFFGQAALNSIPISIPQAIKPAIEATANFSFFTGEGIESVRERSLLPGYRERPNTTELAKWASSLSKENVSPVMLDYLVKAYGGGLTLAVISGLNPLLAPTTDVAAPTKSASQLPIVGGFFQPNDGNGVINSAYETVQRSTQAKRSFDLIVSKGNVEEARAFAVKYANELTLDTLAGSFTREMGELAAAERAIRASKTMTSDEKADKIKQLRAIRIKLAETVKKASGE